MDIYIYLYYQLQLCTPTPTPTPCPEDTWQRLKIFWVVTTLLLPGRL